MGGLSDHQEGCMGGNADEMNIIWEECMMGGISDHQEGYMGGHFNEMFNCLPRSTPTTSHFPRNLDN